MKAKVNSFVLSDETRLVPYYLCKLKKCVSDFLIVTQLLICISILKSIYPGTVRQDKLDRKVKPQKPLNFTHKCFFMKMINSVLYEKIRCQLYINQAKTHQQKIKKRHLEINFFNKRRFLYNMTSSKSSCGQEYRMDCFTIFFKHIPICVCKIQKILL